MNNAQREERRKLNERREDQRNAFVAEDKTSPHKLCEKECIELKTRIKALESLLARAGDELCILANFVDDFAGQDNHAPEIIAEIDAILPATEGDKDA